MLAALGGIAWGFVMALVAFRWEGGEVVLLQAWILCPAWLLGRAAGRPDAGALAGLAVVASAIWTYELLPGWGLETALARQGAPPTEVSAIALGFDRDDLVLITTHVVGALAGLGGALRPQPEDRPPAAEPAAAAPGPDPALSAPLWARLEPAAPPDPPSPPVPAAPARPPAPLPWGSALLLAALATDFFLDRVFDLYTRPQGLVALAFLAAGVAVAAALARRYAIVMLLAGAILASAFAAIQDAEYGARHHPEIAVIR